MNAPKATGPTAPWRDRRMLWVAVPVALLVLLLLVWALGRDSGSGDEAAELVEGGDGTAVVTPEPGVDASGSPIPEPSPGQTAPAPATPPAASERGRPVRVGLRAPAELGNGVVVDIVRIEAVQGEARGPGETAGPALRFTLRVTNDSAEPVNLSATAVTAYGGSEEEPAGDLSGPGARSFTGTLAPGEAARGVYVFAVPPDQRGQVRVDFSYGAEAPRAVFSGSAA